MKALAIGERENDPVELARRHGLPAGYPDVAQRQSDITVEDVGGPVFENQDPERRTPAVAAQADYRWQHDPACHAEPRALITEVAAAARAAFDQFLSVDGRGCSV